MLNDFSLDEAQKALKGIAIPPQPKLLTEIGVELQKISPDVNRVAARIAKDVGLSAAVLKVMNSPFFGLRTKTVSIPNAVHLLGTNNIKCIVTGMMLKGAITGPEPVMLERFWDSSEKVARISAYIASILPKVPRDEAYTFGLFRECGIPLLMLRFPDYKETLRVAAGQTQPMTMVEEQRHGTNHAVVGYMVGKSWGLPERLYEAILRHHDYEVFSDTDQSVPMVRTLVSINYLAEYLNDEILRMRDNEAWRIVGQSVLSHLGIGPGEFSELRDDIGGVLNQ